MALRMEDSSNLPEIIDNVLRSAAYGFLEIIEFLFLVALDWFLVDVVPLVSVL